MRIRLFPIICFWLSGMALLSSCSDDTLPAGTTPPPANGGGLAVQVINDLFEDTPIVIAGSGLNNIVVSFMRTLPSGEVLEFIPVPQSLPVIMEDQAGNQYDLFGTAVSGPNQGRRLTSTHGFMGYWVAIGTFYERVDIYGVDMPGPEHPPITGASGWEIPPSEVFSVVSKDAIVALDSPKFEAFRPNETSSEFVLADEDLLVGVQVGNIIRLYPHRILDWHEIANDCINNTPVSIIYCPLTGTASAWERTINGQPTTFGVSGMLYNSNIIPYDRLTESIWSQLYNGSVIGELSGRQPTHLHIVETTWQQWRRMYPGALAMSFDTGFARNYNRYPYGDYKTNHAQLFFPVSYNDTRLPAKERVHAVVIGKKAKAYRLSAF